jgi:hypothetical protein
MGLDVLNFIGIVGSSVTIHFLDKRCLSVPTTHVIQTRD